MAVYTTAAHTERERERHLALSVEELPEALAEPLFDLLPTIGLPDPRPVTLRTTTTIVAGFSPKRLDRRA